MRRRAVRCLLSGVLVGLVGSGSVAAQGRPPAPSLSKPPAGGEFRGTPEERAGIQELQDNARRLYDRAYKLRETADALRDRNRYEEAESYEDNARELEEQARGYERRAEEARTAPPKHHSPSMEE